MTEARPRPRRELVAYVLATTAVTLAGLVVSALLVDTPRDHLAATAILGGLGVASMVFQETGFGRRVSLSMLSIFQLAAIPVAGPLGAAFVGGVGHLTFARRLPLLTRVFNTAMMATVGWTGGLVYVVLQGTLDPSAGGAQYLLLRVGLPLLGADLVQMLVNALIIAGIVRVDTGQPVRVTFVGMVSTSGLAYLGYGAIGFLFVVLWFPADVGPFSAVLILAPLFVARWIIAQYADEVRSHESALSGLVTAAEIKDPASRGHSARVAEVADWMVEPLGLTSTQATDLRFAAQLHDVGMVALPTRVVRRGEGASPDDLRLMSEHPTRGAALLGEMDFLHGSLPAIAHHHERWDGTGYPDGLAGEDIPLGSRVVAVADAFDALTTRRPQRAALEPEAALAVIRQRSGSHFDPRVVEALAWSLGRHAWTPAAPSDEDVAAMGGYLDHDDPAVADLVGEIREAGPVPEPVPGSSAEPVPGPSAEPAPRHVDVAT